MISIAEGVSLSLKCDLAFHIDIFRYFFSQLLEPKQAAETPTNELKTSLFSWGSRSQAPSQTSSQITLV